ncbi:MAG TPA: glycosyltransferase [Bryobacteraceae bacterium]|nr:glycosyltransferase [Bryobacteraceae bacterium]
MRITILGLSITSSWGNGHATTYRSLVKALHSRGHEVTFLERDVPWYASNRDNPEPEGCDTLLYANLGELKSKHEARVAQADFVIVGSYVPEGVSVGDWALRKAHGPVAFYDIDTPVTLAKLERGDEEYLSKPLIKRYDLYLSFTGGPTLERLERTFGSPCARVFYCSADPSQYFPEDRRKQWLLGYLGTYSADRQPAVDRLLCEPARELSSKSFVVAGPMYPKEIAWPSNVQRIEHLPPNEHRCFYNSQSWTLNVTRADMIRAGWSPSVRLFEAGACGVAVISDPWEGLGEIFRIGEEIIVAHNSEEAARVLRRTPEDERKALASKMRARVLAEHTAERRAEQLEAYTFEVTRTAALVQRR